MSNLFDVIVVGAGIVGAACAFECTRAGMRTAVVERDAIGTGATAAGMGHIVVMDDSPAQLLLTSYSQSLWKELQPGLPKYAEYEERGTLWIASDSGEMEEVQRKHKSYREYGVRTEVLNGSGLAVAEPALRKGLAGALSVTGDAVLYAPGAARFLLERALMAKATLYRGAAISLGSGAVLLKGGTMLYAPRIINAAGEWATELTPGLQVKKRKGCLAITDRYPRFLYHQLVEVGYVDRAHSSTSDSVSFNVQPRSTGQILIGSSRQYDVDGTSVDSGILSRMLQRAMEFLPGLHSASVVRAWAGFRTATSDMLPLIGPWRQDASVFLAAGHEGLGITTSLATARLLADYFAGRQPAIPIEPYLPERIEEAQIV